MLSHRPIYSIKNLLCLANYYRFLPVLISFCLILAVGSCHNPKSADNYQPPTDLDHQTLKIFTDRLLVALATHDEQLITQIAQADPDLTGRQITVALLGPEGPSIILGNWNADLINITVQPNQLNAQSETQIYFRRQPNHPPQLTTLIFNFERSQPGQNWQLNLADQP